MLDFKINFKDYLIGFTLSIILTIFSSIIVLYKKILFFKKKNIINILILLAIIQTIIHMIYFLHMNSKSEKGWIILSLIFTNIIIFIIILGSIWVMNHLKHNMSF
ncbi:cytochrome o ubiquinol oxidase subunit IV [Candidatus Zinderia endosymbiont of Aphrophora alni]|uniref:cytochrome o ubiquinol oxidase subunit IV n=1 Tax=Candidatus Zinderia endosymbiont of Aphrophora alni TaxID=3077951 RepID=UPI0030CB34E8